MTDIELTPTSTPGGDITQLVEDEYKALDEAARADVREHKPANTVTSYASDRRAWQRFCTAYNVPEHHMSVGLMVAFVRWMRSNDNAVSTIERRITGVRNYFREQYDRELSKDDGKTLREEINRVRRETAQEGTNRGRGRADAITVKNIRTICTRLPDTLSGHRDRAMLLIGFGIGARRSELADMQIADITPHKHGLLVNVRWSKTGAREAPVVYGTHDLTCPVRAWRTWLEASGVTKGAAFRSVDQHGNVGQGMSAKSVGAAFNRIADRAGVRTRITGHSLRSGMATEAREAGHDAVTIARQGGWSETSPVLYRYMRTVDQWANNALVGIGL